MTTPMANIKGMTEDLAGKLKEKGIKTNEQFLEIAAEAKQRRELAKELGVDAKQVLNLANRTDLARVKGVSGIYSDLLEQAGVDTIKELSHRKPENLHAKIVEVNNEKKLTARVPTAKEVENWVAQAKELPKTLTY